MTVTISSTPSFSWIPWTYLKSKNGAQIVGNGKKPLTDVTRNSRGSLSNGKVPSFDQLRIIFEA